MTETEFDIDRLLRAAVRAAPGFIAYVGQDYRYGYVNEQYETFFGNPVQRIVGSRMEDVMGADAFRERKGYVDRALAGHDVEFDCPYPRNAQNLEGYLHVHYAPDIDPSGHVRGLVILVTDVTERKEAEDALRASEEKYRHIVETTLEGVCVSDVEGRFTFVNRRLEEILGYGHGELLGKSFLDLMDAEARAPAAPHLARGKDALVEGVDFRVKHRDGSDVWVRFASKPLVGSGSTFSGALALVVDITRERKAREAEEKQRARLLLSDHLASVGTLAAGVAHEINSPLASVLLNLEMMGEQVEALTRHATNGDAGAWNELREMLGDAREGADRVRRIVHGMRTFSRPEEEQRVALDVRTVLDSALTISANQIKHRANVVKAYAPIPFVEADEARLSQVFINLLVNAAHAITEGAAEWNEIRVVTGTTPAGKAMVEIRDTGAGISDETLGRIFDPFFTTKEIGEGTGLGLSICYSIVHDLGGEIQVETEIGKGSVFRVLLLPMRAQATERSAPPTSSEVTSSRRGRVLVVDDEGTITNSMPRLLREHEVRLAKDGREALELLKTAGPFDVILCDLMMPVMTGMDLHAELARTMPEVIERMIFVSGGAFTPAARAFLERVPNVRLEKPFHPSELRMAIRRHLT